MKRITFILIIAALMGACSAGSSDREGSASTQEIAVAPENLVKISLDVEGMTCTGCESSVERSLSALEGVTEAKASHESGKTVVSYDRTRLTEKDMEEVIASRGYKVTGYTTVE